VTDPVELAERLADAFDLGRPTAPIAPVRHVSQETWRLDTTAGPVLVKRFWKGPELPWQVELDAAMRLEQQALAAGVDTPSPVPPRAAQFGAAAQIDGLGIFRAYPFLPHRPLEPDDDIADWVGETLARIQHLAPPLRDVPAPTWWYNQFPQVASADWHEWLEKGTASGRAWVPALGRHLRLILDLSVRVTDVFAATAPHVQTHRDFEPWNVLMVPHGRGARPMLIDWDVAGPDSAVLEAAHVLTSFARHGRQAPDSERIHRSVGAYVSAGGQPPRPGPDLLVRTLGMRLAKISQGIRADLTGFTPRSSLPASAEAKVLEHIEGLPALLADTTGWADQFPCH
jgi:Ser/Thr protein kinase RdoA (MazF antagonist)